MKAKHIAIYLRISTKEQKKGFSFENQRAANRNFVVQHFGRDVRISEYSDTESGFSIVRKDYLRLIEDCEQRIIDGIVVWRIDRFMRNTAAGLEILSDLTVRLGIPVFSVSEGEINFKDPSNKLVSTLHLGISEMERTRIQARVMPGMKRGAEMGHYQGTRYPSLGMLYNKKEKRLEWVDHEVRLLKILFEKASQGESVHSIARYLHQQGYRNRKGKALGVKLLCDALKREIYVDGLYRWNNIISKERVLEPFITRPVFERANRTVAAFRWPANTGKKISRRDDSNYFLQGVLKCRHCGGNLIGHPARLGIRYYVCGTYFAKTKAACKGQWIKADPIEAQSLDILRKAVSNKFIVQLAKDEVKRILADRNPEILTALRLAEKDRRELELRLKSLLELRFANALTIEQFKEENQKLLQEKEVTEKNISQLEDKRQSIQSQNLNTDRIFAILTDFDRIWNQLENKAKKSLFSWVFKYAHAVCLGRRKPKFIDQYELNEPFKILLEPQTWKTKKTSSLSEQNRSNIRSSPMAVK